MGDVMTHDTIHFVENLQKILTSPLCLQENSGYLDLSCCKDIKEEELYKQAGNLPQYDPITEALALILETMEKGPFELTRLGINELLKSYLIQVQPDNEEPCTKCYFECIYQTYLFSLLDIYPYTDLFWEYISTCFDTISKYLIMHKLNKGCQVFLDKISIMGKLSAQKGLHTSSIQHFLHNMESWAREEGFDELADNAKNNRFNLEAF